MFSELPVIRLLTQFPLFAVAYLHVIQRTNDICSGHEPPLPTQHRCSGPPLPLVICPHHQLHRATSPNSQTLHLLKL